MIWCLFSTFKLLIYRVYHAKSNLRKRHISGTTPCILKIQSATESYWLLLLNQKMLARGCIPPTTGLYQEFECGKEAPYQIYKIEIKNKTGLSINNVKSLKLWDSESIFPVVSESEIYFVPPNQLICCREGRGFT